jgi:integrase
MRACKASGTPTWSPHGVRHHRISLWHRQGETWALIGARVGQRSLSVTADTYTHVLLDYVRTRFSVPRPPGPCESATPPVPPVA